MFKLTRQTLQHLVIALALPLLAAVIQWVLWPYLQPLIWLLFYPAVFFSAWLTNRWGGVIATLLSVGLVLCLFTEPQLGFQVEGHTALYGTIVFVVMGFVFSYVLAAWKQTNRRADVLEQLQASEARYRDLVQQANSAIIRWRPDGTVVFCNEFAQTLFGYTADELIGHDVRILTPERESTGDDLSTLVHDIATQPDRFAQNFNENVCRDGRRVWLAWTNTPVYDAAGHLVEILAVGTDITARKQAEAALRQSEEEKRFLLDNMGDFITRFDRNGVMLFASGAARQFHGYEPAEIVNTSGLDRIHPDDHAHVLNELRHVVATGQEGRAEYRVRHKSGKYMWVEGVGRRVSNAAGEPEVIIVQRDITARKQAAEAVRTANERLQQVMLQVNDLIWFSSLDGSAILDVNPAFDQIYGFPRHEFIANPARWLQAVHPDDQAIAKASMDALNNDGHAEAEYRIVRPDGSIRWLLDRKTVICDDAGRPVQLGGTAVDITERKQIEAALRASEDKFRRAFMVSPDSVNINRLEDGVYVSVNHGFTQIMGYTEADVLGKSSLDLDVWVNPQDRQRLVAGLRQSGVVENLEAQFRAKDGRVIDGLMSASVLELGGVPHIINVTRDITERKRIEAELRRSEERYQQFVAHSFEAIYRTEFDAPIDTALPVEEQIDLIYERAYMAECNAATAAMYGLSSPAELIGTRLIDAHGGKDNPINRAAFRRFIAAGYRSMNDETAEYAADGRAVWFLNNTVGTIERGHLVRLWGTSLNITERKQAEQRVQYLTRLYATLSQVNQAIVRVTERQPLYEAICRIVVQYGEFMSAWIGQYDAASGQLLAVARHGVIDEPVRDLQVNLQAAPYQSGMLAAAVNTGQVQINHDIQSDPRMAHWHSVAQQLGIQSAATIPLRQLGQVVGVLNLFTAEKNFFASAEEQGLLAEMGLDISFALDAIQSEAERRQAEQALRDSEQKYRDLIDGMNDSICVIDFDTTILDVNAAAAHMLGYTRAELLALKIPDIDAALTAEQIQGLASSMPRDKIQVFQTWHRTKDGQRIPVEVSSSLVSYHGRTVIMSIARDITERMQAEAALRESEEKYRLISDNSADVIWVFDPIAGRFTYVSPSIDQLRGYTPAEVMAQPLAAALTPESQKLVSDLLAANLPPFMAQGTGTQSISFEVEQPCKDGSTVQTEVTTTLMFNQQGQVQIIGVSRDITARKRAEAALRDSEARYRRTLDDMLEGCQIIDFDWRYVYVNDVAARHGRVRPADLLGHTMLEVYPGIEQTELFRILKDCRDNGAVHQLENTFVYPDGSRGEFELSIQPSAEGIFILSIDITERKRAEQERLAQLRFVECMDRVNRAMQGTADLEATMSDVLDVVLNAFECDRAGLVYPCDPDAPSWSVPIERTKPEWPGALAQGAVVPMEPQVAGVFRVSRATDGPVEFGPGYTNQLPAEVAAQFNIQSQITLALYPKIGKPWNLVMHQCAYQRVWTAQEKRLLQEIGWRLADGLTSLLAYRNLRESEARFRSLYESMTELSAIHEIVYDPAGQAVDYRIVDCNPAFEQIIGIPRQQAIGVVATQLYGTAEPPYFDRYLKVAETGDPISFETDFAPLGRTFSISAFSPQRGRFVTIATDITERKRAEAAILQLNAELEERVARRTQELAAANARLTELDRLKSKFVSDVSHELRTPVTSLSLYIDLLVHGKREKRDFYVSQLQEQMVRLHKLINDILDLSRLERDRDEGGRSVVEINSIVEHVSAMERGAAESAGLTLICEVAENLPPVVARPDQLTRAITNLVSNAIKYTPRGTIRVETHAHPQRVCVDVIDTGMGIPADELPHLFDRFYRGRAVAQSTIPGTGLGLAIVKEIVELHGGTVEVESEVGQGSAFHLWLPIAQRDV